MRYPKILVVLLLAATCVLMVVFDQTVNSQGQSPSTYPNTPLTASQSALLALLTNQADKTSGTGLTVNSASTEVADEGPGAFTFDPSVFDPTNPTTAPPVNSALATNGGTASASSSAASGTYAPGGANDGDRKGNNWGINGGWNDGTRDVFPDWLQVEFNGSKTINQIKVYTLQNNWTTAGEPDPTTSASGEGILDFDVQTWDGSTWVTVDDPATAGVVDGNVTNNDKAMRVFTFPPITTTKVRVLVAFGAGLRVVHRTKAVGSLLALLEVVAVLVEGRLVGKAVGLAVEGCRGFGRRGRERFELDDARVMVA